MNDMQHTGERGSETANAEQPDKTVRFEQESPNPSSSSTMHVSLASGGRQD